MATGNIVSICNRALLSIGSQTQISSLNEGSTAADACSTLFTPTYESLARTAYWNCLRKQATLTLLAAASGTPENPQGTTLPLPPTPWLYMYQLPSDCLQARFIVPSNPNIGNSVISPALVVAPIFLPGQQAIKFHVAYSTDPNGNPLTVILTNEAQAQLVYTVNQPNPQIWDSEFQAAMVASLAAYLVPALSLNMNLQKIQINLAESIILRARTRDANEGTSQQDYPVDWIVARNAGTTLWNTYNGAYSGGYGSMGW